MPNVDCTKCALAQPSSMPFKAKRHRASKSPPPYQFYKSNKSTKRRGVAMTPEARRLKLSCTEEQHATAGSTAGHSVYLKQISWEKLPKCLCIHINKTSTTGRVLFEDTLMLRSQTQAVCYCLVDVVVHLSGVNSGQYVTYRLGKLGYQWYKTSDASVRKVSLCEVRATTPYMLLYVWPGCPGLPNIGATCFFNSAIQSLAPCTPLKLWLESSPNSYMNLVCELLKDLNEKVKTAADPSLVLNALRERGFPAPNRQQDCHELLQHLLEVIEEEEAKNDCDGAREEHPFLGKHAVAMHCKTCGYKYPEQINSFHSLTLNMADGKGKIEELLAHYVRKEVIEDVDCTKCTTKPEAEGAVGQGVANSVYIKQLSLQVLPQCLCIHINKTSIHGTVSFEEDLLLTEALEGIQRRKTYGLVSVVCHHGGLYSGHYITYRLGAGSKSRVWFYTSDLHVYPVSWSRVKASSPYMLMYCQVQDI